VKLFVLDPHTIYRRGLVVCLESLPEVESVAHAGSIPEARELAEADLVILDPVLGLDIFAATGARVMVCTSDCTDESVLGAIQAGAVGYLRKDTLTPEILGAAVAAAANGTGEQLCYSERTVKNVLHDVVTKLNARSPSQAVAFAVREGLI
jgi:DNA-binding NarL/FixJ family response regulator